ncbi:LysR family transcriptional regulator [Streptomyces sp. NBC_00344]|uniref:LysR family transcriptional regulator n=1 Tax=Streptomyces sp. NBC_00344 TaxID=2975720 RepID=UPI002E22572C
MDLLAHLEAYVATAAEASFSRAAERLGIAQPLLSRRIKTLEEHFGGRLFDRSRRQVTTTQLGVVLLPYAHDVLERAQQLRHVARSARDAAVRTVGVPADCDPRALAQVIRAGVEHATTIGLHEVPPAARAAGLADGSLAYALVRVLPESGAIRVPLGLASMPSDAPDMPGGRDVERTGNGKRHGQSPVHLDEMRPRRRADTTPGRRRQVPILTAVEDQVPYAEDRFARAAARAGLPEGLVRPAGSVATALAETLAGRAVLLCAEPFARRHGAGWSPLNDVSLHRGYDVTAAQPQRGTAKVPDWLVTRLAVAVGAATATSPYAAAQRDDAPFRLAARG